MKHHDENTTRMIEVIMARLQKLSPSNIRRVMIVAVTLSDMQGD